VTENQNIELACARLLNLFTTLNDAGHYEELVKLFAEDGQFARPMAPDAFTTGRENIRESFESRRSERISRHLLSNIVIDVVDENTAKGRAYAHLILGVPENKAELGVKANSSQLVGDYLVDFVNTVEGWKIARLTGNIIFTT
jgi:hypothetical protein